MAQVTARLGVIIKEEGTPMSLFACINRAALVAHVGTAIPGSKEEVHLIFCASGTTQMHARSGIAFSGERRYKAEADEEQVFLKRLLSQKV
jgi:hypothetical protein